MEKHFMVSDSDGALYDTRAENWSENPLRADYQKHFQWIENVTQLKATLRAGKFAFPGGYPLYFIADDGEAISFEGAKEAFCQIVDSISTKTNDGFRIVGCQINFEETDLICAVTGAGIDPAF